MTKPYTYLGCLAALVMTACSTAPQQSPYYVEGSATGPYSNQSAPAYSQQASSSYDRAEYQACVTRETNREIIGGALGGTAGAFVGKEVIGGTKGAVAGAALGGVAGYGAVNLATTCGPDPATRSNAVYQTAPAYQATPARFLTAGCPGGTTAQPNGTCLLETSSPAYRSGAVTSSPPFQAPTLRNLGTGSQGGTVVTANTLMQPSAQIGTNVIRQIGGQGYEVSDGDTVYSLARKLCVSVLDIQSANGLSSNYGIQIGQTLDLPSSRC